MYIRLRTNSAILEFCEILPERFQSQFQAQYFEDLKKVLKMSSEGLYAELPMYNYWDKNKDCNGIGQVNSLPSRVIFATVTLTGRQLEDWPQIKKILKETGFKRLHKPHQNWNMRDKQLIHVYGRNIIRETGQSGETTEAKIS